MYGSNVHILSAGKCWVTAHQPGDARFEAAPDADQLIPISKAGQRVAGAAPEFKTYLDPDFPLDMSATSGLPVVFVASGDCTVNGFYIHTTGAGTCALTAHQPGDSNYLAARIVDQQFPIARADQTIDFPESSESVLRQPRSAALRAHVLRPAGRLERRGPVCRPRLDATGVRFRRVLRNRRSAGRPELQRGTVREEDVPDRRPAGAQLGCSDFGGLAIWFRQRLEPAEE